MAAQSKGKWIQRNEAQWRSLLSRFSDSGLSVSAFCQREAVSTASFYRWRGLIERPGGGEGLAVGSEPAFVDLGTLILISYQDDTNYGMLRVVSDDRRNAWQDLDR
jgi:hypothetical protein